MMMDIDDQNDWHDALLFEYACGALDEAASLLIAAYLTLSPPARRQVAGYEACGGALISHACAPVQMKQDSLSRVLDRMVDSAPCNDGSCAGHQGMPGILQSYVSADRKAWKPAGPGIRICEVTLASAPGRASVTRMNPGRTLSRRCEGLELALVLDGAFSDGQDFYNRGRLTIAEPGRPVRRLSDSHAGCLYFTVNTVPRRRSPLERLMDLLHGG